jgi:hypothetical protein
MELALDLYLTDSVGSVNLVVHLRLTHKCFWSSSNSRLQGGLHYRAAADIDEPLNETAADKLRDHRADYNNRPFKSISVIPAIASTSGRLHCELVCNLFLQTHRETACLQLQELGIHNITRTSAASTALLFTHSSNVRSATSSTRSQHFVSILTSMTPLSFHTHTHPTNSQTSRLLSTSLFPTIGESGFI